MWFSSAEKEIYQVYEGDLLVVEGGAGAGGCAIVKELTENVYVQNSIMIVRSKDLGCNSYLRYYIESLVRRGYIDIICNKATIPHFTKVSFSWYEKSGDQTWRSPCEILLVETLVLLSHKEPDSHISVNIEFGEGEGQISLKEVEKRAEARKPKEKVTYKMIQQYIEENYDFKVHTAYIAEVKRSLGLPMYDAPNVVEELKHPRPHPTERMVAAIKETLAHFDFI